MKVAERYSYLRIFIARIAHLVDVDKLTAIVFYQERPGTVPAQLAACIQDEAKGTYKIMLRKATWVGRRYAEYTKLEILEYLAHELAHLKYWIHTIRQAELENEIMRIFLYELRNQGET